MRAALSFNMRLQSVALAAAVLSSAVANAQTKPVPMPGSPDKGRALILAKGCGGCHVIPGVEDADGLVGPPLTMMGRRIFIAGVLRNTPANLAAWVLDPQRFVPGNAMPSTGLTQAEAMEVAA